jgi:hypothetical protein
MIQKRKHTKVRVPSRCCSFKRESPAGLLTLPTLLTRLLLTLLLRTLLLTLLTLPWRHMVMKRCSRGMIEIRKCSNMLKHKYENTVNVQKPPRTSLDKKYYWSGNAKLSASCDNAKTR